MHVRFGHSHSDRQTASLNYIYTTYSTCKILLLLLQDKEKEIKKTTFLKGKWQNRQVSLLPYIACRDSKKRFSNFDSSVSLPILPSFGSAELNRIFVFDWQSIGVELCAFRLILPFTIHEISIFHGFRIWINLIAHKGLI